MGKIIKLSKDVIGNYPSLNSPDYYSKNNSWREIIYNGLNRNKSILLDETIDFYIEPEEIFILMESVKDAIKKLLNIRKKENRQIITRHTLTYKFDSCDIQLNNKDDYEDIFIINLFNFLEKLNFSYQNNERLYFNHYEPEIDLYWENIKKQREIK
ncbi:MAG: hypothetical protein MUC49_14520 [Raineya sp.]|jgi:hypothetical protein|nr:hypothetical protein [Raineya sp.]